jgi:hypothetical protein
VSARGQARRRAELVRTCRLAGFELVILEGLPPIAADVDGWRLNETLEFGRWLQGERPRTTPSVHGANLNRL